MTDAESAAFLQWALPHLGLRWDGYRNVRGRVVKRVRRRIAELGLPDAAAYRERLEEDPAEWEVLRSRCAVTLSRFYRNAEVWDAVTGEVLSLAASAAAAGGEQELRCWSIGCASGEEPYTLAIAWKLALAAKHPGLRLRVVATDVDERVLARAEIAEYAWATLRELPPGWIDQAFEKRGDVFRLREAFRDGVELRREDVRLDLPDGAFRVITCRNSAGTYFDEALQRRTLDGVLSRLADGGFFVLGRRERLLPDTGLEPWDAKLGIYRQRPRHIGAPP